MRPLIVLLVLLLGGCWESAPFYSASDAVSVIEPGRYEAIDQNGARRIARIGTRTDGMTRWLEDDREDVYGLFPLDRDAGRFIVWTDEVIDDDEGERHVLYALLQRLGPGEFLLYIPSCRDRDAEVAVAAGAEQSHGISPTCRFSTRAQLESAFRRLHPGAEESVRLTRLPDGPR